MFKFLSHHKKPLIFGATLILVAIMAVISGLNILVYKGNENKSGRVEFVIGNKASASTTADYTCDGVDDNVQIQAALNALPATGGKISLLGGTYSLSANITRAINNVTIEGVGQGTVINRNGVNPVITAGGNNWVLANFDTDAGDVSFGATTGYTRWNVNGTALNVQGNLTVSTLTNGRIPIAGAGGLLGDDADLSFSGDTLTVTKVDSPTGRSATLVVAASNASTTVKNQADVVCDGTADNVQMQSSLDTVNAAGGGKVILTDGTFDIASTITLYPDVTLEGYSIDTDLIWSGAINTTIVDIPTGARWGLRNLTITGGYIEGTVGIEATDISSACANINFVNVRRCQTGIWANNSGDIWLNNVRLNDNRFPDVNPTKGIGLKVSGGLGMVTWDNGIASGNFVGIDSAGIFAWGRGVVVANNYQEDLIINGAGGGATSQAAFYSCDFEKGHSVWAGANTFDNVKIGNTTAPDSVTFDGCYFQVDGGDYNIDAQSVGTLALNSPLFKTFTALGTRPLNEGAITTLSIINPSSSYWSSSVVPSPTIEKLNLQNQYINELANGDFEIGSLAGWTLSGAGATIARSGTQKKTGSTAAYLTRSGTDCFIREDLPQRISYYQGREVTFGCWVYATVASRAKIEIYDSVGSTASAFHSGVAGWEWLTVKRTIDAGATFARARCMVVTGDTSAYFDGAIAVQGDTVTVYENKADQTLIVDHTATETISAYETGNVLHTNYSASGAVSVYLPGSTTPIGFTTKFCIGKAVELKVVVGAAGQAIINNGTTNTDDGGADMYISADDEGEYMSVTYIATGIWLANLTGTWTVTQP